MASQWPPKKGAAFNLSAFLYKNDGTLIANPGTLTLKISKDYGDWADSHNSGSTPTEEDSTYGQIKIALDTTDTNADVIDVYLVDNTSGCVPFTATLYTTANTQDEIGAKIDAVDDYIDTELGAITAAVITNAAGADIAADIIALQGDVTDVLADTGTDGVVLAADAITAAKIADNAIAAEHIADDAIVAANLATGCLTADAFAADALVAATFATDCITDDAIGTGAIASTAFAAGAITAAAIANGAIDNATFAADVGSTALATNVIATAAAKAWDAATADHATASTFGKAAADILADTDELQTNQGDWATATGFSTHSAADVVTALDDGATLTTCATATGFAVAGDEMDLIDAPNATAVTAIQNGVAMATDIVELDDVADAVWDEDITTHEVEDSAGEALGAAGSAGDPWVAEEGAAVYAAVVTNAAGVDIAADIIALQGDVTDVLEDTDELQGNQGEWATATGFSTHSAADVVTELGTGATLTSCATATGFAVAGDEMDIVDDPNPTGAGVIGAAVWGFGTADNSVVGSYGVLIETNLDAPVSEAGGGSGATLEEIEGSEVLAMKTDVEAVGTAVSGLNDLSSGDVETAVGTALGTYDPPTKAELDAAVAPLALAADIVELEDIADAVWDEDVTTHDIEDSTGEALAAAAEGGAGGATAQQVWEYATRALTDKAGFTLHSDYDAAKTAASQTSVNDIPTNSELSTALGTADDAVLAAVAALNDFDPATDVVAHVTLVDTTTTNTDMVSEPDNAGIAAIAKWYTNQLTRTDNGNGTITYVLYDDDDVTPLKTWVYTTASGTRAQAS